jgi:pyruvate formate lyase activating enzyme
MGILILVVGEIIFGRNLKEKTTSSLKEAMFYQKLARNHIQCQLCPRKCIIPEGKRGFCRVRENRGGKLYTLVYNRPCAVNIGPIEKAPLYHFHPGHKRLTVATVSCNLRCKHCHNWHISQVGPGEVTEYNLTPEEIVKEAKRRGVKSISFTYTEPTVFYEYIYDISKLAKKEGIKTSIVSNGYINPEPLKKLLPYLDAVKIDLKAFTEKFYREICSAELEPVLRTLKVLKEEGAFFEIVNLIIPTIKDNLGEDVPLHFSRFTPAYKLTLLPATPVETLEKAVKIAQEVGLKYVYIGNVPGHKYNSTFCPKCKKRLIHRVHFSILSNNIKDGKCRFCQEEIHGIWDKKKSDEDD